MWSEVSTYLSVACAGGGLVMILLIYKHWARPLWFNVAPYVLVLIGSAISYSETDFDNAKLMFLVFSAIFAAMHMACWYDKGDAENA